MVGTFSCLKVLRSIPGYSSNFFFSKFPLLGGFFSLKDLRATFFRFNRISRVCLALPSNFGVATYKVTIKYLRYNKAKLCNQVQVLHNQKLNLKNLFKLGSKLSTYCLLTTLPKVNPKSRVNKRIFCVSTIFLHNA